MHVFCTILFRTKNYKKKYFMPFFYEKLQSNLSFDLIEVLFKNA